MADALVETRRRALRALAPPPRLSLAEWSERTIVLPDSVSALPGPLRLYPFQRGIAEAISAPTIERVTLVKSVRVGLTTLLSSTLASYVANEPAPILVLLPTESDCRDYVVSDVEPIFEATPQLRNLLAGDERDTILSRRFPGGSLKIVAAKSPRNLRRHNVRVLLCDEVDAMEPGAEGNPLTLAERRTLSFPNRKIILGSTPIFEHGNVLRSYAESDQRIYEVPCPDCGALFEILWDHIEWEPNRPQTAACRCPHCESLIAERHKGEIVARGDWRATAPHVEGHAGFRLNALISPLANASWSKLAAEFLASKDHPDRLQTFVNTLLGQGWREAADELDEEALAARAEPFDLDAIPAEVLFVTLGVDVQDDRLEATVVGFGRDALFVLAHHVFWGSYLDEAPWADLDALLKSSWPHPLGGRLKVDAALIDSGSGAHTQRVYDFARPRAGRRVFPSKGASGSRPPAEASKTRGRDRLFVIGVDGLKTEILNRLSRGRTIRFSKTLPPSWFEQVTSERRVVRYRRGAPVRLFERIPGRAAEALDALVYAMGARHLVRVPADAREAELSRKEAPQQARRVLQSAWLQRT